MLSIPGDIADAGLHYSRQWYFRVCRCRSVCISIAWEIPALICVTSLLWSLRSGCPTQVQVKKNLFWGIFYLVSPQIPTNYALDCQPWLTLAMSSSEGFFCLLSMAVALSWVPSTASQTRARQCLRGKGGVEKGFISTVDGSSVYLVWPIHLLFPQGTKKISLVSLVSLPI